MKYKGSCHCQKVSYEVEMNLEGVVACNCSMCQRKGTLLAFAPESSFKLLSGEKDLTDYQFHKKVIHHTFCSTCGVTSFASGVAPDGTKMKAINVRCLEGVELEKLPVQHYDGRSID